MSFKFLVVDDTSFMRKMAADCLKQYGHDVVGEAVNGKEAVKKFKELQPHVVMMDLTMPEMNGIEAIKEILKIDAEAVILVCSASNQKDMIQEALEAGAVGYLVKPFKPDYMNEIIKKYAAPHLEIVKDDVSDEEAEIIEAVTKETKEATVEVAASVEAVPAKEQDFNQQVAYKAAPETEAIRTNGDVKASSPIHENKTKFKTSYMCNFEDEVQGEKKNFAFTYTENDRNICLEMNDGTQDKQSIRLSLDGFRELNVWLEQRIEEGKGLDSEK